MAGAREFIRAVEWRFASTYAATAPHEYTIRNWRLDIEDGFKAFAVLIWKYGYVAAFKGRRYLYLELDGWKYWTVGSRLDELAVINRERLP